jgi:hypothetical protein
LILEFLVSTAAHHQEVKPKRASITQQLILEFLATNCITAGLPHQKHTAVDPRISGINISTPLLQKIKQERA